VQIPDVPPQLLAALVEAAAGQRLALVGGVVRDLLLHRHHQDPWRGLPDLDLLVEGNALILANRLPETLHQNFGIQISLTQQLYDRYKTVKLDILLPEKMGGRWLVDLASARREIYIEPASNPLVSSGTLEQDLARRDFTINAMALELLDRDGSCCLLDLHQGQSDLVIRRLRLLHSKSFVDDPTRIVRAARYGARFGFELAPETFDQVTMSLHNWPWKWRPEEGLCKPPPALGKRLGMELDILLAQEKWNIAIRLLWNWGALVLFDDWLQKDSNWISRIHWAPRLGLSRMLALISNAGKPAELAGRLGLPKAQLRWIEQMSSLERLLKHNFPQTPSAWTDLIEANDISSKAVGLMIIRGNENKRPLLRWILRWSTMKSPITGKKLLELGWPKGPSIGLELWRQRALLLDQDVDTRNNRKL